MKDQYISQKFIIVSDLRNELTKNFLGFCRYIVMDTIDQDNVNKKGGVGEDFKGYLFPVSKESEAAAWKLVWRTCNQQLAKYYTEIDEDIGILDGDDGHLGKNKRNCILFRKIEKMALLFLKDCSKRVETFMTMKRIDVIRQIKTWQNAETYHDYFRNTLVPLL